MYVIHQKKKHNENNSKRKPQCIMPVTCMVMYLKYDIQKHNGKTRKLDVYLQGSNFDQINKPVRKCSFIQDLSWKHIGF